MKRIALAALLFVGLTGMKPTGDVFYIYQDTWQHYIPSGWMGDYGDLKVNPRWEKLPASGKFCAQIKYSGEKKQGSGWAGIYFQNPPNNWGNVKGGFDLTGYTKLKFKARGEKGGEIIEKFMAGGIQSGDQSTDSFTTDTGVVELTKDWKEYTLDLSKEDLSSVIGGFGFVMSADTAPEGLTFYLDEVRYEK